MRSAQQMFRSRPFKISDRGVDAPEGKMNRHRSRKARLNKKPNWLGSIHAFQCYSKSMPAYAGEHPAAPDRQSRTFLVIAHPGHELRVHHWLETARPEVWVLTDGSGRTGRSRVDSTTRVLRATGSVAGAVYGQMSDGNLYHALLNFDHRRFTNLVDQLAAALMREQVDCIAGDAAEGYNPAHDVCRLIINAAARLVERKTDKQIPNYDFTLVSAPSDCPNTLLAESLWLDLDDTAFARKLSAARNYPELQAEVEAALQGTPNKTFPEDAALHERSRSTYGVTETNNFRVECLRPLNSHLTTSFANEKPFYEEYGERQVEAGHYTQVLRYREHVLPLAAALDAHVERSS